ncbi:MAG TPA: hypothetical protein VFB55_07860, partial [Verrucomicrobiae bacterium]|nr:hypothetical protein [Verrucomicrobiae bacterium]
MALCVAISTRLPLSAQTVWNGNSTVWNTAGNWSLGLPSAAQAASFGNPSGGNYNLTFTGAGTALGLTFTNAGTSAYNFNTSGFTLTVDGNGITNNSTFNQTFSGTGAVSTGATQTWTATSGDLIFNQSTLNINNTLTLTGANGISVSSTTASSANITYTGSGTGANGASFS